MSTTLEDSTTHTINPQQAIQRLRSCMAAIRLIFTCLGTRKSFTTDQKTHAVGPEQVAITASNRLLDPKHLGGATRCLHTSC